jgi:hypothetical protein
MANYVTKRKYTFYVIIFHTQNWKFGYLPPENSTFSFDHARTLVSLLEGLIEFSHMRHLIGWRHNFYPGVFFTQKWKFGYLSPENSTFNFDHARTLVSLLEGFIEFSHKRHLIGWRHNFYLGIISTQKWKFGYLPPENSSFNFDHARTLVSLLEGFIEFSHKRHLIGWRHNFYPGIFFTKKWKFGYLSPENSTFNFGRTRTLVSLSKGLIKFSHKRHLIGWRHNFYLGIFFAQNENSDIYLQKIPPSILVMLGL